MTIEYQSTHPFIYFASGFLAYVCEEKTSESWRMWWCDGWGGWKANTKLENVYVCMCKHTDSIPSELQLHCERNVQVMFKLVDQECDELQIFMVVYMTVENAHHEAHQQYSSNERNIKLHCKFNTHFQLYQSPKEISLTFSDCVWVWVSENVKGVGERDRESMNVWKRVNTARMFRILLFFFSLILVCVCVHIHSHNHIWFLMLAETVECVYRGAHRIFRFVY